MPFDGRNYEPERKEPSLEGLIEWLEGQEPGTEYNYGQSRTCLLARYAASQGYRFPALFTGDAWTYRKWWGKSLHLDAPEFCRVANGGWGYTYGEALIRARALLRETAAAG